MRIGAILGIHVQNDGFEQSVRFITTDQKREEPTPRVPIIGLDAGCIPGTNPGCSARALEEAGKEIVRSRMAAARKRLSQAR